MMPFDFKIEFKEIYMPKDKPQIITIPPMNYIAVEGTGEPNIEGGEYQEAIRIVYGIAYTIKMSKNWEHRINGYFDFVVPPLEGFWWQGDFEGYDKTRKQDFHWLSVIRLSDFVKKEDFDWAKNEAQRKIFLRQSFTSLMKASEFR